MAEADNLLRHPVGSVSIHPFIEKAVAGGALA